MVVLCFLISAPVGVQAPIIQDSGATYLVLEWLPPTFPNGVLTGYALYMNDNPIFFGVDTSYNITGLHVRILII